MGSYQRRTKNLLYMVLLAVFLSFMPLFPPVLAVSGSPTNDLEVPPFDMGPDLEWSRTFGGSGDDRSYSVQQTSEGGFIIAGSTLSYGSGESDVYLVKTDSSGYEEWSSTFGGSDWDEGHSVQQSSDGGFIIAGHTISYGAGGYDVYIVKTDSSGDEVWSRTFGGSGWDGGYSVEQTSDGGFIIAGKTKSYGRGGSDVYIVKTDSSGNEVWSRTFGGSSDDGGQSVQQTSDGGFIIAGWTDSYGRGGSDVYIVKTDSSGNEVWSRTFGGSSDDGGQSVQQTSDGGFIIAGWTDSYGAGGSDVYLVKTDSSGYEVWSNTFGGSSTDGGYSVQQTSDGGFFIAGQTKSYGAGGSDVYIVKTDSSGEEEWSGVFGGSGSDFGYSVQQTSDGGFIISGVTESYGAGYYDVYLMKVTPELTPTPTPMRTPMPTTMPTLTPTSVPTLASTPTPTPDPTPTTAPTPTLTPIPTPTPTPISTPPIDGGLNGGIIAGIVAGALIVILPGLYLGNRSVVRRRAINTRIRELKDRMEKWREEGWNVQELEDLFK